MFRLSIDEILHVASQVAEGISTIHDSGFCVGILNSDSIVIVEPVSNALTVRLTQYAVRWRYHMVWPFASWLTCRIFSYISQDGADIQNGMSTGFSIAPEQLVKGPTPGGTTFKTDMWALGIVLLEMATVYGLWVSFTCTLKVITHIFVRCHVFRNFQF